MSRLQVLPFDRAVAEAAGALRAALERQGRPIGPFDLQIAATAQRHGLALVTNNRRAFERVDGLTVEDWTL